jgi:hypothetical protein
VSFHYWLQQVAYEGLFKRRLFREGSMAAVLSGGVEHSLIGARPLVRLYSPPQLRRLLRMAGFEGVATCVRHSWPEDAWPSAHLVPFVPALRNQRVLDRIGRIGGWYVIGRARRPA